MEKLKRERLLTPSEEKLLGRLLTPNQYQVFLGVCGHQYRREALYMLKPFGMPQRSFERAVESLQAKGLIQTHATGGGSTGTAEWASVRWW